MPDDPHKAQPPQAPQHSPNPIASITKESLLLDKVRDLVKQSAFINLFATADPDHPDEPIPAQGNANAFIGLHVHDIPRRFSITVHEPTATGGLRANNLVGKTAVSLKLNWMVMPDDFEAAPGKYPPPTELDFSRSQRFTMLDGHFDFGDGNFYTGFGAGRTFPAVEDGKNVLRLGAVATIVEGSGKFKGHTGLYCIQGYITPPRGLFLNYLSRIVDTAGDFLTTDPLPPDEPIPNPDPNATFLTILGEDDPTVERDPKSPTVPERLRLVHISSTAGGQAGIRSNVAIGPIIGTKTSDVVFNPFEPTRTGSIYSPYPYRTVNARFTFFDKEGKTFGSFRGDIDEGRVLSLPYEGSPVPAFRFAGFGQIREGTGQFSGADGMITVNSVGSFKAYVLSDLFTLRIYDPQGKFRTAVQEAWS